MNNGDALDSGDKSFLQAIQEAMRASAIIDYPCIHRGTAWDIECPAGTAPAFCEEKSLLYIHLTGSIYMTELE